MKNNQDNQIQSITLCNMFFREKGRLYAMYTMGSGAKPLKLGNFREFLLKVTLQSVRLLLTVGYRKNGGAGFASCSPNYFVGGAITLTKTVAYA